jgi:1-deoxy-D-xylulose-5-phosphate synthase
VGKELPADPAVLEAGRAELRREGKDVALLAVGRMVAVAEEAADLLAKDDVEASVCNMRWIKPLDYEMVSWAAAEHRLVVTVEENTGVGGFGAGVLEVMSDLSIEMPVLRLSVPDCFVTHGAMNKLLAEVGLDAEGVSGAVLGRLMGIDGETETPAEERVDDTTTSRRRPD